MNEYASAPVVVVVGAGVAGLIAARHLTQAGAKVIVVDKGRGVGGRMATRRIGGAVFDHGAQFFTARSESFTAEVGAWATAGVAVRWFTGVLGADGVIESDDLVRYRGVPAMTGIAKHLAANLDVRLSTRVQSVRLIDHRWHIEVADGDDIGADAVVLTAPAPQTLSMLDRGSIDPHERERLEQIAYDPCIAVLAVLDRTPGIEHPGARRPSAGPVAWYADNQAKGVSTVPALTVHAGPDASRALWDANDEAVIADLLDGTVLGGPVLDGAQVVESHVQRWRYARTVTSLPETFILLNGAAPAAVAGDGFGAGGLIEGAALSGLAAATAIADLFGLGELDPRSANPSD